MPSLKVYNNYSSVNMLVQYIGTADATVSLDGIVETGSKIKLRDMVLQRGRSSTLTALPSTFDAIVSALPMMIGQVRRANSNGIANFLVAADGLSAGDGVRFVAQIQA